MTSEEKKMIREDICREPPLDLPEKIVLHNQDHFEELLFDVIDEFQTKGALYEITVKLKFLRLWAYLLNEHRQNSSPPFPAGAREMERVKDYIHLHVKDPLTLDELASRFNISKYHLSRVFKSIYALPPVHYHQKLRMEKIREMILYTTSASLTLQRNSATKVSMYSAGLSDVRKAFPLPACVPLSVRQQRKSGDSQSA